MTNNTLTNLNTINGMPVHFYANTMPFESMVRDILNDILAMNEKECKKYGHLEIWCNSNTIDDTDYTDSRDRNAIYECIYGIISFKIYVDHTKDWYLDDWSIDESSLVLDCETMLKLANIVD